MIAIQPVERFEDLDNGPESLSQDNDGQILIYRWADDRFVMVDLPKPKEPRFGIAVGTGSGGTSTIAGATDFTDTTGAGTDGYSITWNDTAGKFVLTSVSGGSSTIAGASDFTDTTGAGTDEYTVNWDNDTGKFVLRAPIVDTNTTTIADGTDFTDTTGAGTDNYSIVWDNGTGKFILVDRQDSAIDHGSIAGLSDDDHTQYLLATGARTGATSAVQDFTTGVRIGHTHTSAYELSVQSNATEAWIEILNSGGTDQGAFFGMSSNDFQLWSYQGGNMTFYSGTSAGSASERMRLTGAGLLGVGQTTPTAYVHTAASTTSNASLRIASGTAPTSPNTGDVWFDGTDYYFRVGSSSYSIGTITRTTAIRPLSDSTTAFKLQNAAGTTYFEGDSTNLRLRVYNPTSSGQMLIGSGATGNAQLVLDASNGDGIGGDYFLFRHTRSGNRFSVLYADGTVGIDMQSTGLVSLGGSHVSTARADIAASTTSNASVRIRSGTAPTSPNDGDMWFDGTSLYFRAAGTTRTINWT